MRGSRREVKGQVLCEGLVHPPAAQSSKAPEVRVLQRPRCRGLFRLREVFRVRPSMRSRLLRLPSKRLWSRRELDPSSRHPRYLNLLWLRPILEWVDDQIEVQIEVGPLPLPYRHPDPLLVRAACTPRPSISKLSRFLSSRRSQSLYILFLFIILEVLSPHGLFVAPSLLFGGVGNFLETTPDLRVFQSIL